MNPDDLSDVRLDRDPDDLLPEDWDEVADSEIDLAGIKLADMDDSAETRS